MVADDNEAHWTLGQYWTRPRRPAGPIGIERPGCCAKTP